MIQHNLYKGVSGKFGAIQFSLKDPILYSDEGLLLKVADREAGVVFVSACSSVGKNKYDWNDEVQFKFALGITDLGKLIHFMVSAGSGGELSLVHDPNKGRKDEGKIIKSMRLFTGNGCMGGMMITTDEKKNGKNIVHKIPVTGDEVVVLKVLFEAAISRILGWS
jgi:hypothetical protein